jgi:hypothetical protein
VPFRSDGARAGLGAERFCLCQRRRLHGADISPGISIPLAEGNEAVLHGLQEHIFAAPGVEKLVVTVGRKVVGRIARGATGQGARRREPVGRRPCG